MSFASIRRALAEQLERGVPTTSSGEAFSDFESLFLSGRAAPPCGLYFSIESRTLVAAPFAIVSQHLAVVPFNFELSPGRSQEDAARAALSHMLLLAARVRQGSLPTVEKWLAKVDTPGRRARPKEALSR